MQSLANAQQYGAEENSMKRRRPINAVTIQLEPGKILQRVTGGYIIVGGKNISGSYTVELRPGEILHEVLQPLFVCPKCAWKTNEEDFKSLRKCKNCGNEAENFAKRDYVAGYIIQPPGAPTLSAKGVANLIKRSITWVHKITRRGPLDALGGLQGYIVNSEGNAWVPKFGTGINGSEVMYYVSDIEEWLQTYAPPSNPEEDLEKYRLMEVPKGLYNLFKHIGEQEQAQYGYVTRTKVLARAKEMTKGKDRNELQVLIGREKPVQDRDYPYLIATAIKEGWKDNPRRSFNTAAYRRKPRIV